MTTDTKYTTATLGSLFIEQPKSNIKVSEATNFGNFPFFTSGDIVLQHISPLISGENIFMATGGQANVKYFNGAAAYSTDTWAVKAKDAIDAKLLYYNILSLLSKIDYHYFQGSGLKHLQKKDLKRHKITFPTDPKDQERIVATLKSLDIAITETETLIAKYELVKRGLMHDLLTNGIDKNGNIRAPQTHTYKISPLGLIPQEWDAVKLREIGSDNYLKTGPFGSSLKTEHWQIVGVPVITIGAIGESDFITENLLFISEEKATELQAYRMQTGDILFSRVADVGRALVIKEENEGWVMSSNFMRLRLDQNKVLPQFIFLYIKYHPGFSTEIAQQINASGRSLTNSKILNNLDFLKIPKNEQIAICNFANRIDEFIKRESLTRIKLLNQKIGLLHDLLSHDKE
ncbi:restriction endonuclease subunit S [uncultured Bacteroides sp.]|uniref:restriction endonuclease subunit S n=2 Tax=uncultured Bacteroides sp. TaxID=162156 RepID=UPI00266FED76|nr:restriction endonuclease subunit S [uncultured Bacteroides sp.]